MKEQKEIIKKEKKPNKFIQVIKKKWLVNGSRTIILVLIILAAFIGISIGMKKLDITPLDFTEEKRYTLTDESKQKVEDISQEVNIYFVGYAEDDSIIDLAKDYKKANENIHAEAVNSENRPDLVQRYGIESGSEGIIVECGEKSKVLTPEELVRLDVNTYEQVDIAEEKITSSIVSVTTNDIPKVYFLEGYSEITLTSGMNYLTLYLQNEINEIDTLNIISTGKVPDDCDTLVITTPNKDFDDIATKAITDYIDKGGNILWLNSAIAEKKDMPNVNKILAIYGVKPFEPGVIRETDANKMVSGSPDLIMPDMTNHEITKALYDTGKAILINATKINIDTDNLDSISVEETDFLEASNQSYFRTNFNIQTDGPTDNEEKGSFVVGCEMKKAIGTKEAVEGVNNDEQTEENANGEEASTDDENLVYSKLVIYGENYFITDGPISQSSQYMAIQLGYNKDLILNSIAYLSDREEDIIARKGTGTVTYTPTEQQDTIIRVVIFAVPVAIVIAGIVVWQVRRRKK